MNVNVIVLQMKIDFWIVGGQSGRTFSRVPASGALSFRQATKWNQRLDTATNGSSQKRICTQGIIVELILYDLHAKKTQFEMACQGEKKKSGLKNHLVLY